MSHELFSLYFPGIAERETRGIRVTPAVNTLRVPVGQYFFMELYCTEPDCDCRNVQIVVINDTGEVQASISYGWEPAAFYEKWMGDSDPVVIEMFRGPALTVMGQESPYSDKWLKVFSDMVNSDGAYKQRLIRHYQMMKKAVAEGTIKST